MSEIPVKLPLKLGDELGYNADKITDADHLSVCQCYGIPINTMVSKARNVYCSEGIPVADYLIQAANAFPVLFDALLAAQCFVMEDVNFAEDHKAAVIKKIDAALALAKGATK